ncbi:hypothetical protein [Sphingomonas sp. CFBP 13706]|uniref:hypothetical protein n=1 Tax=Sphingomonas sp. CFBP 13706 TaxID=2775314 RepID=UPI001A7E691F|nr:hypothetical protein [Sphingomonas sp. CFBP 13706]
MTNEIDSTREHLQRINELERDLARFSIALRKTTAELEKVTKQRDRLKRAAANRS